jgi:hypothetical protein
VEDAVYSCFRRWSQSGAWDAVVDALRVELGYSQGRNALPTAAVIDSQNISKKQGYDSHYRASVARWLSLKSAEPCIAEDKSRLSSGDSSCASCCRCLCLASRFFKESIKCRVSVLGDWLMFTYYAAALLLFV